MLSATNFLAHVDAPNTLLQLSLAGITSLGDRVAMLARLENDLRHRLRHLAVRSDDLVGRPREEELAALAVEGMLGTAATKLNAKIDAGGPDGVVARRALERLFVECTRIPRSGGSRPRAILVSTGLTVHGIIVMGHVLL